MGIGGAMCIWVREQAQTPLLDEYVTEDASQTYVTEDGSQNYVPET